MNNLPVLQERVKIPVVPDGKLILMMKAIKNIYRFRENSEKKYGQISENMKPMMKTYMKVMDSF